MTNEDEENKDLSALYESLNPQKKSLLPLSNNGMRRKSQTDKNKNSTAGGPQ
jgi:hypothetical protein